MATNQFKVHGQLPLHGMTVSAVPLDSTHVRQAAPEDEPPKEAQLSLCQRLPPSPAHLSGQLHVLPPSLTFPCVSPFVYFGPRCPRYRCCLMFFPCLCRSERVKMSGGCRTPSRWWESSSRWWWQRGKNSWTLTWSQSKVRPVSSRSYGILAWRHLGIVK